MELSGSAVKTTRRYDLGDLTEHFSKHEFRCRCNCGEWFMDPVFTRALERVRQDFGQPMTVNSGYRCEAHNKKEGGVPGSAHTLGLAADVACPDGRTRHGLVFYGIRVFNRIGIGTNFVHFDIDASKPHEVIWLYKTKRRFRLWK